MEEVRPENGVTILTSYKRIFMFDAWDVEEEDGEYKGTCDKVSKVIFTDGGVLLKYPRVNQFIPNHQMISMTW